MFKHISLGGRNRFEMPFEDFLGLRDECGAIGSSHNRNIPQRKDVWDSIECIRTRLLGCPLGGMVAVSFLTWQDFFQQSADFDRSFDSLVQLKNQLRCVPCVDSLGDPLL